MVVAETALKRATLPNSSASTTKNSPPSSTRSQPSPHSRSTRRRIELALDTTGDKAATEAAFAKAAHVTTIKLVNQRVVVNAMEPRACLAPRQGGRQIHALHRQPRCARHAHRHRQADVRIEEQSCASSPRMSRRLRHEVVHLSRISTRLFAAKNRRR